VEACRAQFPGLAREVDGRPAVFLDGPAGSQVPRRVADAVTRLDHDANVTPWVRAARDAGAAVRFVGVRPEDCTLRLDELEAALSPRTRLVAVAAASNAVGTVNPVQRVTELAHAAGALVFVDAVHYAPHLPMDVADWGCDFAACSAYKFFGPHVGLLWGKWYLLEELPAYAVRPAAGSVPGRCRVGG
jgi:selenocysteine lyase/cysteine desulfurase